MVTPMLRISVSMVATSCRRGTFCSTTGWSVRRAAHSSGSVAFLAPEIRTSPWSCRPPRIKSLSMGRSVWLRRPFGRRVGLHRERMHLVGMHSLTQRGVNPLVALDQAFALEFGRNDHRLPMAPIALDFEVITGKPRGNDRPQFVAGHG